MTSTPYGGSLARRLRGRAQAKGPRSSRLVPIAGGLMSKPKKATLQRLIAHRKKSRAVSRAIRLAGWKNFSSPRNWKRTWQLSVTRSRAFPKAPSDRKSVVEGKSEKGSEDIGVGRHIKK